MVDWNHPKTVDEAVDRLVSALSLKDRVYIASLSQDELYLIHISLRAWVYGQGIEISLNPAVGLTIRIR